MSVFYPKLPKQVDLVREFKDILSDFVTSIVLPENRDKFLREVYSTINIELTNFKNQHGLVEDDIIFVYKGGNILRLQYLSHKDKLPCYIYDQITTMYDKYFKTSDADFSIYVNPKIPNYHKVYDNVNKLTIQLLNKIRSDFELNQLKYFDYYKFNKIVQSEIHLSKLLSQLNESNILKDGGKFAGHKVVGIQLDDVYYGEKINKLNLKVSDERFKDLRDMNPENTFRNDFMIRDHSETETKLDYMERSIKGNGISPFYISDNDAITIKNMRGTVHFSLLRMKINFRLFLKKSNENVFALNVGGELIDITLPHSDDFVMEHFNSNKNDYVEEYIIGSGKDRFGFKGYSIKYIIDDLERMLFIDQKYPWEDSKYEKRLNRLMLFYFLELIKNYEVKISMITMKNMIDDLKIAASGKFFKPKPTNNYEIRKMFYFVYEVIRNAQAAQNKDLNEPLSGYVLKSIENMINFLEFLNKISHIDK